MPDVELQQFLLIMLTALVHDLFQYMQSIGAFAYPNRPLRASFATIILPFLVGMVNFFDAFFAQNRGKTSESAVGHAF